MARRAEDLGRGDGEPPHRAQPLGLREFLRLGEFRQDAPGAFEVARPGIGERDRACGARQQPHAQMRLQRRHLPRDGRGDEAQMARGGCEAMSVHHGDEGGDGGEAVHGIIASWAMMKCQWD